MYRVAWYVSKIRCAAQRVQLQALCASTIPPAVGSVTIGVPTGIAGGVAGVPGSEFPDIWELCCTLISRRFGGYVATPKPGENQSTDHISSLGPTSSQTNFVAQVGPLLPRQPQHLPPASRRHPIAATGTPGHAAPPFRPWQASTRPPWLLPSLQYLVRFVYTDYLSI